MAYRYEKTASGNRDLVIDGWEDGIALSPYKGIGNMRNLNTGYYPGVIYSNYRRQAATISAPVSPVIDNFNGGTTTTVASSLITNIVSYYKLDESSGNAADSAGTNTLTNSGVTYGTGLIHNGAFFGSSGSGSAALTILDASETGLNFSADFTISLWAKLTSTATGSFMAKQGVASGYRIRFESANTIRFTTFDAGGDTHVEFAAAMTTGAFHFLVIQRVGTTLGISIDNSAFTTASGTLRNVSNTGIFALGNASPTQNDNIIGTLDEVGIWSRALTTGEITTLYNGGIGLQYNFSFTNIQYTHTCSGSNRSLIIATQVETGDAITGVTYAGISATLIGSSVQGKDGTQIIAFYGLLNPRAGPNIISVTRTSLTNLTFGVSSISFTNVRQSGFPDNNTTNTGTTSVTTTLTTVANNCYALSYGSGAGTLSADTGETLIGRPTRSDSVSFGLFSSSSNPISPAGSVSMKSTSSSGGSTVGQTMVSIAPAAVLTMGIPVQSATSPAGLNYILDTNGSIWKQSAVNSTTFSLLDGGSGRVGLGNGGLAFWNNYLVVIGANLIEFCGNGTGDAGVISSNWNIAQGTGGLIQATVAATVSPSQLTISSGAFTSFSFVNEPVQFTTTGTLPAPLAVNTTYYITSQAGVVYQVSATVGGSNITFTTTGSGTHTITAGVGTATSLILPLGNVSDMTFTGDLSPGSTTATITAYTTPGGVPATSVWLGASGQYNIVAPSGDNILATFTNGSAIVSFLSPITFDEFGTFQVNLLTPNLTNYRAYISKVEGNLYFANGRNLGRVLSENLNTIFNPSSALTYVVDYSATTLLQPNDSVVTMTDLQSHLVLAGNKDLYSWDYVAPAPTAPVPVGEQIVAMMNILNNLYITAGQKGNIYVSNGYSAQLLYKIPDFIAGIIDPVWSFGGLMFHRAKLFFQAIATSASSTKILSGIFSLNIAPAALQQETASGLVMETQNSFGLVPATAVAQGVLIDNEPSANGNDSYYSAWGSGAASTGGVDYNDTSLWQNFEPVIETDMVPTGTNLEAQTFGQIEYKLDRPLISGDSIRLSFRTSLADSYTLEGTSTSTTATLSEKFISNIRNSQWVQFKVEFSCAPSNSSFIPLREIRLHSKTA